MVRVRQKKINTKSNLHILRESDLTQIDTEEIERAIDATTGLPKIESGVESKEEREHHLQAVISAAQAGAGKESKISIPTPEATRSDIQYGTLFPSRFAQPATYIRFSSTVEDCIGTLYCMNEDDEQTLKSVNAKHAGKKNAHCSEEWFEQIINSFEETTALKQPFAAVDHPPVLGLDEMQANMDEKVDDGAKAFAADIYEYWKDRRAARGDHSLMAQLKTLKMESGQEADDSDPYVCFRRREHRQARKTRGRDAQVIEKLKKLRKELEEGRYLLDRVKAREAAQRDDLSLSRTIFEQRAKLRQVKRENNITDNDEELLINQKAPKRRVEDQTQQQRPVLKFPQPGREGNYAPDADSFPLADALIKRERDISAHINNSVAQHDRWNRAYLDDTLAALYRILNLEDIFLPVDGRKKASSDFVGVKIERTQQPTPPESVAADSASDDDMTLEQAEAETTMRVRWAQPVEQKGFEGSGRYRMRTARGGRVMMDRHNLRPRKRVKYGGDLRFAFDHDSGDESDPLEVELDSTIGFQMRASWQARENHSSSAQAREVQRRTAAASAAPTNGANGAHSSPDHARQQQGQQRAPQAAAN